MESGSFARTEVFPFDLAADAAELKIPPHQESNGELLASANGIPLFVTTEESVQQLLFSVGTWPGLEVASSPMWQMGWPCVYGDMEDANCDAKEVQEAETWHGQDWPAQEPAETSRRRRRGRGGRRLRKQTWCETTEAWDNTDSPTGATAPAQVGLQSAAEVSEDPLALAGEDAEAAQDVLQRLDASETRRSTLMWLLKAARPLALSKQGCRVVQKALDVADTEHRAKLLEELQPHAVELYESPNGNHVLTKVIEIVPAASLGGVIRALQEKGFEDVAKHRYGCRVLERLIEHCHESELLPLVTEVLRNTEALSRHPYGNFVVQHLFEHAPNYRKNFLECILPQIPQLAMHRTASHVVQQALRHSDEEDKRLVVQALLMAEGDFAFEQVAQGRYGSFVAEQLAELHPDIVADVQRRIGAKMPELRQSPFGRRVAETFGFPVPESSTS